MIINHINKRVIMQTFLIFLGIILMISNFNNCEAKEPLASSSLPKLDLYGIDIKEADTSLDCGDIQFYDEPGMTKVCENPEKTTCYYYDEEGCLFLADYYRNEGNGERFLYQKEHFFWIKTAPCPRLASRLLEDEKGEKTRCYCFYYDGEGRLSEERIAGNLSGECQVSLQINEEGYPEINGVESYSVRYGYSYENSDLVICEEQDNGLTTSYEYDEAKRCIGIRREFQGELIFRLSYLYDEEGRLEKVTAENKEGIIESELIDIETGQIIEKRAGHEVGCDDDEGGDLISRNDQLTDVELNEIGSIPPLVEMAPMSQIWEKASHLFFSSLQSLQLSVHQTKMKLNAELKLPAPYGEMLEKMLKNLIGGRLYLLTGPQYEETHVDAYGSHEINDKVRVTFINGILNTRAILEESLESISSSHGGVKVHHVFRPTEGWTWDISRAIVIKTGFGLGFRSFHASLLAQLWKELIAEMGGVEGGGVIIHYAHSLGGTETDRAREFLTPAEQKMIRVVTIGSATMVRNEGFQSVVNHISANDGVSSFIIEPLGRLRNFFDPHSNIIVHGRLFLSAIFPFDHQLDSGTYQELVRRLGDQFLKEFAFKF